MKTKILDCTIRDGGYLIMKKRRAKYKAILFDFDGVIGKTTEDNYAAWKQAFSKYDIGIEKTEYYLLEGMNTKEIAMKMLERNSRSLSLVEEILRSKEDYYLRNNSFVIYKEAERLLPLLKKRGYLLGLVSGGSYSRIAKFLTKKFMKLFDVIVTGDKVKRCKPHPEPYLSAVTRLYLNTDDCLVIENSPLGIKAAHAAGIDCIAVCSTLEKKYLKKAGKIIDNLSELCKII